MKNAVREIEVEAGEDISSVAKKLVECAPSFAVFNDVRMRAVIGDTVEVVQKRWWADRKLVERMMEQAGDKLQELGQAIPILLHCPLCSARHIDEGDFATKVHHTHACQSCGHCWRPAVVPTVGVRFLPVSGRKRG